MLVKVLHITPENYRSSYLKNWGKSGRKKGQNGDGLQTEQVVTVTRLSDGWGDSNCKQRHS